ncbi:MAG: DUF4345 family protein [Alphaproteobacteria bacterium]
MENVIKIGVGLVALLFTFNGLMLMFAPEAGIGGFAITAEGPAGLNTVRGDLGGLFLGGAILAALGMFKNKAYLLALAIVLGVIMLGRIIGLSADGFAPTTLVFLLIEAVAVTVLIMAHRQSDLGA